jgi:hypothetical protein
MIPEPENHVTSVPKPNVSRFVLPCNDVRQSIHLHNEACVRTEEVHDVVADWSLTAEF